MHISIALAAFAISTVAAQGSSSLCEGVGWPVFASAGTAGSSICIGRTQSMAACQALRLPGGKFELTVQNDGNLVVYNTATKAFLWASGSNGPVASDVRLSYLSNGDIQMVSGSRVAWSLETVGSNGLLCIDTNNGKLTFYDNNGGTLGNPVWDSFTNQYKAGSGYPNAGRVTATTIRTTTVAPQPQPQTQPNSVDTTMAPRPSLPSPVTPPPPPPSPPPPFPTGAIAAIVVVTCFLLGIGGFLLYRRKKAAELKQAEALQPVINPYLTTPAPHPYIGPPPTEIEMREVPPTSTTGRPTPSAFYMAKDNYPIEGQSKHDGELILIAGARVEVVETRADGWCRGRTEPGAFYWVHNSRLGLIG
ncbi:hypothetical protein BDR26DRAFT_1005883 [Obelidium mucronatum]|nr:hypothetical protein BDR26DRAFT_1005883 [Obelidium mucronatum]